MGDRVTRVCLQALLVCSGIYGVHAAPSGMHIRYVEPVELQSVQADADASQKPASGAQLIFDAYGRRFEAALAPNDTLTRKLGPAVRDSLGERRFLRGRLIGLPRSWVRLSEEAGSYSGVLWDGHDLYAIAPYVAVRDFVPAVLPLTDEAPVVYRLSDVDAGLAARFCDVLTIEAAESAPAPYETLTAELQASVAAAGDMERELEVAVLGDYPYAINTGDAIGEMLARMNIVDGIFSDQAGISIVATDLVAFTVNEPFTSSDAPTLLNELGAYREATPTIRERGLAHLLTGRYLNDDTAGIAYRDGLCDPYYGVSLSESHHDRLISALIIAHELGHNFGAPHDGEPGACVAEPQTYLMAPQINSSSTFSACSLGVIEAGIDAASCVRPASRTDAAVQTPEPVLRGETGMLLEYPVDVIAVGTRAVRDITLTVTVPDSMSVGLPFDVDVRCTSEPTRARCQIDWVAPDRPRRLRLSLMPNSVGTFRSDIEISAPQDLDTANNRAHVDIIIDRGGDVGISPADAPIEGATRAPVRIPFEIEAFGPDVPVEPRLEIDAETLAIDAIRLPGASCTVAGAKATCSFGSLPVGTVVAGELTVIGERAGFHPVELMVGAANDRNFANNHGRARVTLAATYDLHAYFDSGIVTPLVGETFALYAVLSARGLTASTGVELEVVIPEEITLHSASLAGGACQIAADGRAVRCSIARIEPQTERLFTMNASAATRGHLPVTLRASSDVDDAPGNEVSDTTVRSRYPVDGSLTSYGSLSFVESFQGFATVYIENAGANPISDAQLEAALPDGVEWVSAAMPGSPCVIAAQRVTCAIESLPGAAYPDFVIRSDAPGNYVLRLSLTVPGDGDTSDNVLEIPITVLPFIDIGIDPLPETVQARSGHPFILPIVVRADRRPVSDVRVWLNLGNDVAFDASGTSTTSGACSGDFYGVNCLLATVPAYGEARLEISLVSRNLQEVALTANVSAPSDYSTVNNQRTVRIQTSPGGDGSVAVDRHQVDARVNTEFAYPTITVTGLERIEQATVRVALDPSLAVVSTASSLGPCSSDAQGVLCSVGTLETGAAHRIDLRLRGSRAGVFDTLVQLGALDDDGPDNDQQRVTVSMSSAPSGGGGSSGGGGGGSIDFWALIAALALHLRQRTRTRRLQAMPAR